MSVQQFFDVLGLSYQKTSDLWPDDPLARRQHKLERLTKNIRRACLALARRRRLIDGLPQTVNPAILASQERRYQLLLRRVVHAKQKVARLRVTSVRTADLNS
jgi:hypothetical protein